MRLVVFLYPVFNLVCCLFLLAGIRQHLDDVYYLIEFCLYAPRYVIFRLVLCSVWQGFPRNLGAASKLFSLKIDEETHKVFAKHRKLKIVLRESCKR